MNSSVLNIIIAVCIVLWLLGFGGHHVFAGIPAYTGGYLIHVLLVIALICLVFRLI